MQYDLTDGARRALGHAANWRSPDAPDRLAAPALLLGLLTESECRAALVLARHGVDADAVHQQWPTLQASTAEPAPQHDPWLTETGTLAAAVCAADVVASLLVAAQHAQQYSQSLPLATEHLLLGLAAADHPTAAWLRRQGIDPSRLEAEICQQYGHPLGVSPTDDITADAIDLPPDDPPPPATTSPATDDADVDTSFPPSPHSLDTPTLRILDAEANRAREGLRVVEDYVRFALDDRYLTDQFKQLRHDLTAALSGIPTAERLAARETQADVGTDLSAAIDYRRNDIADLLAANFARLQESLRSLEEYGKVVDPELATRCQQIRYRSYTLQRAVQYTRSSLERLAKARLYVLIDGGDSPSHLQITATALVAAGVHVLQLRDKRLDDRQLLQRGRLLCQITRGTDTLLIINDRPDLALLVGADGVHVGQEELSVKDVRTIVGPRAIVGVSTHSLDQARQAVLDGADYIGVGPVFPSGTKSFEQFPGLQLVRQVAHDMRLPAFAIGGITSDNLPQVVAAGLRRVAVAGAITTDADPAAVVRHMLGLLDL